MLKTGNDRYWKDVTKFLQTHVKKGDRIIAPLELEDQFPHAYPYPFTCVEEVDRCQWVVIHKGRVEQVDRDFLTGIVAKLTPVFANEVFVVLSSDPNVVEKLPDALHIQTLWDQIDPNNRLRQESPVSFNRRLFQKLKFFWEELADFGRGKPPSGRLDIALRRLDNLGKKLQGLEKKIQRQNNLIYTTPTLAKLSLAELTSICRTVSQTMYLGNQMALCRVLGKHLAYVDTTDIGIVPHLCLNGYWEPGITLVMAHFLQPDWYCIDVGANHGYFSLLMANAVGASGRVLVVEPNPKLVDLLARTIQLNGFDDRAIIIPKAVSDSNNKSIHLVVPKNQTGHASVMATATATDEVIAVETITIDTLTADWHQVNLVKIDAEGAEEEIWRGMHETIRRNKDIIILFEFGASRYADPKAFLEEVQQEGFILRHIEDVDIKNISIERCITERLDSFWMLFLKR